MESIEEKKETQREEVTFGGKREEERTKFPELFLPPFLLAKRSECQFFYASPFFHDDVCLWDQKCVAFLLGLLLPLPPPLFCWDV